MMQINLQIKFTLFIDIEAAKILCHVVNPKKIFKGYISDISLNPFGFLLSSEIQVNKIFFWLYI